MTTIRTLVMTALLAGAWWPAVTAAQSTTADNHIAYYERLL